MRDATVSMRPAMTAGTLVAWNLAIAAVYVGSGWIGQLVAIPPGNVTIFWPPAGIAMAAVVLMGPAALPGVFAGAVAINFLGFEETAATFGTAAAVLSALGIGVGSAVQAFAGGHLIGRFYSPGHSGLRARTALALGGSAAAACLISSSIGTGSLLGAGMVEPERLAIVWSTWWFGDLVGVILFAPLVMGAFWHSRVNVALLAGVMAFGIAASHFTSTAVRENARNAWETQAAQATARLTSTALLWMDLAYAPIAGMAALFQNSDFVDDIEFLDAIATLEDNEPDFFPASLGFVTALQIGERDTEQMIDDLMTGVGGWEMVFSTDESGPLAQGKDIAAAARAEMSDAAERPELAAAVAAALQEPGHVVVGGFTRGIDGGQQALAVAVAAVEHGGRPSAIIGLIDIGAMMNGLFQVQVPDGILLRLHGKGADAAFDAEPVHVFGAHGKPDDALNVEDQRATSAGAELDFRWYVTDAFDGGPDSPLADGIFFGGIAGTAGLVLFLGFLLGQNQQIRARVRERTAELEASQGELSEKTRVLEAVLESISQGLVAFDGNLKLAAWNERFLEIREYPRELGENGRPFQDFMRYDIARGEFGDGDPEQLLMQRIDTAHRFEAHDFERTRPNGRIVQVQGGPVDGGGFVSTFSDITERRLAERALAEAHGVVVESIEYASRIQRSLLPADDFLKKVLKTHAFVWEPRDVVGGDLYWARPCDGGTLIIVGDCTGHGVPGAFMTIIATGALDRALAEFPAGDPAMLIQRMNRHVKVALGQDGDVGESDDGLELGVVRVDGHALTFAGARFSLFHGAPDGSVEEIKGDKSGIGYRRVALRQSFTNHYVESEPGRRFFLVSDGMIDQIGGDKRRAFGKRRLRDALEGAAGRPLGDQLDDLMDAFRDYQGDEARRDDVTLFAFEID